MRNSHKRSTAEDYAFASSRLFALENRGDIGFLVLWNCALCYCAITEEPFPTHACRYPSQSACFLANKYTLI